MKKATVLLLLAFNGFAFAQTSKIELYDFLLKDQELTWQHVYTSDLNKEDLISNVIKFVTSSNNVRNLVKSENKIRFDVEGDRIDYKRFGGKWGNTADFVKYPQSYNVVINVQDYEYCVTINNIEAILSNSMSMRIADFNEGWYKHDLVDNVSRKRKTEFNQSKSVVTGMKFIQKHYYSKFENLRLTNEVNIK